MGRDRRPSESGGRLKRVGVCITSGGEKKRKTTTKSVSTKIGYGLLFFFMLLCGACACANGYHW